MLQFVKVGIVLLYPSHSIFLLLHNISTYVSVMTLKKYIADSYGSLEGYKFHQLSLEQLELKIKYSEEFLRVIGMVDPGLTKVYTLYII